MIITDDEIVGKRAKHLTTTAKISHPYEFFHDEVGYNFRLPNINAATWLCKWNRFRGNSQNQSVNLLCCIMISLTQREFHS